MPLLSSREVDARWAEGYWTGFVVGLVTMGLGAILGAWIAVWWLGGGWR